MKQEVSISKTINVNGQNVDIEVKNNMSVGALVDNLNQHLAREKHVVTKINIDGCEVSDIENPQLVALPVESAKKIEIFTSTPADLAYETLGTLEIYIDRLIASIDRSALHFREMNLVAAEGYLVKAIDGLDLFIQTIAGVKLALKVGLNQKVALAEADLISTMNDILSSKKQKNYIFLADILSRDLICNLQGWKAEVIPILKNWKMN